MYLDVFSVAVSVAEMWKLQKQGTLFDFSSESLSLLSLKLDTIYILVWKSIKNTLPDLEVSFQLSFQD